MANILSMVVDHVERWGMSEMHNNFIFPYRYTPEGIENAIRKDYFMVQKEAEEDKAALVKSDIDVRREKALAVQISVLQTCYANFSGPLDIREQFYLLRERLVCEYHAGETVRYDDPFSDHPTWIDAEVNCGLHDSEVNFTQSLFTEYLNNATSFNGDEERAKAYKKEFEAGNFADKDVCPPDILKAKTKEWYKANEKAIADGRIVISPEPILPALVPVKI